VETTKRSFSLALALGTAFGLTLAAISIGCGESTPPAASPDQKAATTAPDSDGDGIPDNVDKCPDKKEDGLSPDPKDGCPKA
jgi:hypothetical protein